MSNLKIPQPHRTSVLESKSGRLAVVIGRGVGYNPGLQIQEICKDGRFSKRGPYWIKGTSPNWKGKGSCLITYVEVAGKLAYHLSDFELYETKAPYNPDGVLFPYEVMYNKAVPKSGCLGFLFPRMEQGRMVVMASSGENARSKVASKGIGMVRLARPTKLTADTVIEE